MKKIVIGAVVLVLVAGVGFWVRSKKETQRGDKQTIVTVERGSIENTIDATGEVQPLNRVEIKPPIQGRIEKLLVDEGSHVKQGEIVAWMSSSDRAAILDAARAKGPDEVKKWEDTYKPTPIIAPLTGVIILRNVVVGQTVDASVVLYAMSDQLIVLADVDEADIGRIKLNLPARITLDAYPAESIDGNVFQILYEGKNVSNVITYGVKIKPKNVPPFFRSQMTANVTMILERKENVLLIPAAGLKTNGEGKQVFVPGPEKKPITKEIETGLQSHGQVEVLSGLAEGDKVVIMRSRYSPQKGPQSSPLTMGGRPSSNNSQNRSRRD